jgi:hypothetical protein
MHYPVLFKEFALICIPGKIITMFRLGDPPNPFYYDGKGIKHVSYRQRVFASMTRLVSSKWHSRPR